MKRTWGTFFWRLAPACQWRWETIMAAIHTQGAIFNLVSWFYYSLLVFNILNKLLAFHLLQIRLVFLEIRWFLVIGRWPWRQFPCAQKNSIMNDFRFLKMMNYPRKYATVARINWTRFMNSGRPLAARKKRYFLWLPKKHKPQYLNQLLM